MISHCCYYLLLDIDRPSLSMTGNIFILTGSQISIQCNVKSSSNDVTIEWYKQNKKLQTQSRDLIITNAKSEDTGLYSCIIRLGNVVKVSQANLYLDVRGK